MGLFKRKKQATERVQDLKSRVESLRKVDDAHRALTLNDFLQGDDTVTARSEPRYSSPNQTPAPAAPVEDNLEAELQRYLQRQESEEASAPEAEHDAVPLSDWGFEEPMSETSQPMRPISIDEFPPLSLPDEDYDEVAAEQQAGPPRLSADEEAALIAELQRFVQPEDVDAAPVVPDLLTEDFSWGESEIVDAEPVYDAFVRSGEAAQMPAGEIEVPTDEAPHEDEEPETRIMQLEGRSYEEPAPRHWPSVPLAQDVEEPGDEPAHDEPARWPKAAGDWEPL